LLIVYTEEERQGNKSIGIYSDFDKRAGGDKYERKGGDLNNKKGLTVPSENDDVICSLKSILENTKYLHSMKLTATEDLVSSLYMLMFTYISVCIQTRILIYTNIYTQVIAHRNSLLRLKQLEKELEGAEEEVATLIWQYQTNMVRH
jgi:hypothetical protein